MCISGPTYNTRIFWGEYFSPQISRFYGQVGSLQIVHILTASKHIPNNKECESRNEILNIDSEAFNAECHSCKRYSGLLKCTKEQCNRIKRMKHAILYLWFDHQLADHCEQPRESNRSTHCTGNNKYDQQDLKNYIAIESSYA